MPALAGTNMKPILSAKSKLNEIIEYITNPKLKEICCFVINNPLFRESTGSLQSHQAYSGGLLVHTAEVLNIAINISATPCIKTDLNVLITACIFHDYGKIWDYKRHPTGFGFEYTEHKHLIRHLSRSYAEFMIMTHNVIDEDLRTKIGHCILSHHGRKEWGSPIEPISVEAYILHTADNLSANVTIENW